MNKIKRTIITGTFFLLTARMVNLCLGFGKFLCLAHKFGATGQTDAYFVAYNIVMFFLLGIEGAITISFIPLFVEYRDKSGEIEAWAMAASLLHTIIVVFLLFSAVLYVFSPYMVRLVAPGFTEETARLTQTLLTVMIPLIFLSILNVTLTTIYYANQKYLFPAMASILPMAGGLSIFLLFSDKLGIVALPIGMVGFAAVEAVLLFFGLGDKRRALLRISLRVHTGVKKFFKLAMPLFLGLSLTELNLMVDRFFTSFLGPGAVSAISYSGKLASLSAGTLTVPLSKSLLPHVSRLAVNGTKSDVLRTVLRGVKSITIILIPWCVLLILFHTDLISAIFQHGKFSGHAATMTSRALLFYSFGIVFFAVNMLMRLILFAYKDTATTLKISVICAVLNLVLDFILVKYLGHAGIALATSLVALAAFVLLLSFLYKKHQIRVHSELVKVLTKPIFAGLLMASILILAQAVGLWPYLDPLLRMAVYVVVGVTAYILIYLKMEPEFGRKFFKVGRRWHK